MLERIKPNPGLVKSILDQIPSEVWASDTTTFLDPAFGGGQFISEIEKRLSKQGHTKENIAKRVFGYEKKQFLVDLVYNMHGLVGNYSKVPYVEYLKHQEDQFDVVVTAPPFEDNGTNKKGNLWSRFIVAVDNSTKDDGYLSLVTPPSWMSGTDDNGNAKKKQIQDIFTKNTILFLNLDTKEFFPGVGSHFSSYVIRKGDHDNLTRVISNGVQSDLDLKGFEALPRDLNDVSFSIVKKFLNHPNKKPFTASGCVGHPKAEGVEQFKIHNTGVSFGSSKVEPNNAKERKVVVSVPGYLNGKYDDGLYGCSVNSLWTSVADEQEAQGILEGLECDLVKFIFAECKYSGFNNGFILKRYPDIRTGVNEVVFRDFGLSEQEISYILEKNG
jgi:hypothetical protein